MKGSWHTSLLLCLLLHGLSDFQQPLATVIQRVLSCQQGLTLCLLGPRQLSIKFTLAACVCACL